jgi:hypothetical protein
MWFSAHRGPGFYHTPDTIVKEQMEPDRILTSGKNVFSDREKMRLVSLDTPTFFDNVSIPLSPSKESVWL